MRGLSAVSTKTYPLDMTVIDAAKLKAEFEMKLAQMLAEFKKQTGMDITSIDLIDARNLIGEGSFVARATVEFL